MSQPDTLRSRRHSPRFHSAGITGLLVLCVFIVGCGGDKLSGPGGVLALTSVSPSSGATNGAASVTLTGSGFRSGATVSFGGVTAVARVAGDTRIFAATPAHGPGPVDVLVTNEDGQTVTLNAAFTYLLEGQNPPPPSITAVSPANGSTDGGTPVVITGTGFRAGANVTIGGVAAVATVTGDTRIVADTPAHSPGPVEVSVTNDDGRRATLGAAFTYVIEKSEFPPSIAAVSPAIGSTGGGATVVITGTGFRTGAKVTFDGVPGSLGVLNTAHLFEGSLYVSTPPHGAGAVTVVVTNTDGQSATLVSGFTYAPPGTFDFNGEWDGGTGYDWQTPVPFTIRNNVLVSASCGGVPLPLPSPPPTVIGGEFSIISDGITVMTGRIVTDTFATGRINTGPCGNDTWVATKRGQ